MANPRRHRAQGSSVGISPRISQAADWLKDSGGSQDYGSGPSGLFSTSQLCAYPGNESHAQPTTTTESRQQSSDSSAGIPASPTSCQHCADGQQLAHRVARELTELLAGIRGAMTGEPFKHYAILNVGSQEDQMDPTQNNLCRLVFWIVDSIESTTRILNSSSLSSPPAHRQACHHRDNAEISHSNMGIKRKSPFDASDGGLDVISPSLHHQRESRSREGSSALHLSDEDRTSKASDESPPLKSHSSRSSSGTAFVSPQSLIQPPSDNRVLPLLSPKIASTLMLPPISPSLTGSATYSAHFQELQQQINTRTLAFETLQREHQNLLSAFSRSQSQVATLDKKLVASEVEMNELNDGRVRLQVRIAALEAQVEEIQQIREDAHTQSITEGAQYMQIMAMSSKLQAQGASDLHKWKTEREQWELEKESFMTQITLLEDEQQKLLYTAHSSEQSGHSLTRYCPAASDAQTSRRTLQNEIKELRIKCNKLEAAVDAFRHMSSDFGQAFARLGVVGKRLQQHLQIPPGEANSSREHTDKSYVGRTDRSTSEG